MGVWDKEPLRRWWVWLAVYLLQVYPLAGWSASYDELIESQASLSEEALFVRCYSHLTQQRAPYNHPTRVAVRNGSISAVNGCMQVFDKAMVGAGTNQLNSLTDLDGVYVLNTFFSFHQTWFNIRDFTQAPTTYGGSIGLHHDVSSPACYLTHALFHGSGVNGSSSAYLNGYPYGKVVNTNTDVQCIRSEGTRYTTAANIYYGQASYLELPLWANAPGRGFLIGTKERAKNDVWYSRTGREITLISVVGGGARENLVSYVPRTRGAGLLGSTSYLIKNGQYKPASDGGLLVRRRLTSNFLSEMLCRTAPYRRIEDVSGEVADFNSAYPTDYTLPFRRDATCMSCHSTQDGMAGMFRNVNMAKSQGYNDWNDNGIYGRPPNDTNYNRFADPNDPMYVLYSSTVAFDSTNLAPHMQLTDRSHSRRPPQGTLVYRSFDGSEVRHEINPSGNSEHPEDEGIQMLGQILAQEDDLYVCAAARYFEFFTGISANLQDPGDTRNAELTEADEHYKQLVVSLGQRLKAHQSLRAMVKEIISSDLYRKTGLRDLN